MITMMMIMINKSTDRSFRAVWDAHGFGPPEQWNCGFESHSRWSVVSVFVLFCRWGLAMGRTPSKGSYQMYITKFIDSVQKLILNWKKLEGLTCEKMKKNKRISKVQVAAGFSNGQSCSWVLFLCRISSLSWKIVRQIRSYRLIVWHLFVASWYNGCLELTPGPYFDN